MFRTLIPISLAVLTSLALAACGGDAEVNSAPTPPPSSAIVSSAVSSEVGGQPEGTKLKVTLEADGDPFADMDPEERVKLDASIALGLAQVDEGLGRPAQEVIAELRGRR